MSIRDEVKAGDFIVNPKLYTLLDTADTTTERENRTKALDGEIRGMRKKLFNAIVDWHYDFPKHLIAEIKTYINNYMGSDIEEGLTILDIVEEMLIENGWASYTKYYLEDPHPRHNVTTNLYLYSSVEKYVADVLDNNNRATYAIYRIGLDGKQTLVGITYAGRFFTDEKFEMVG